MFLHLKEMINIFERGFCRGVWDCSSVLFFIFLHFWPISGHFSSSLVQVDGVRKKNDEDEEKT